MAKYLLVGAKSIVAGGRPERLSTPAREAAEPILLKLPSRKHRPPPFAVQQFSESSLPLSPGAALLNIVDRDIPGDDAGVADSIEDTWSVLCLTATQRRQKTMHRFPT